VTALALGVAACGGDDEEPAGGPAATECPEGAVVIAMRDVKFEPADATAKVGQEICWPNEDEMQHNAVAEAGADFKSELYGEGEIFTASVSEPGTVRYVCTIHPGMDGTIEVTP
jgi:plastocyanin